MGNKSPTDYLKYIANMLSITKDEVENLLSGRLSSVNIRELTADKIVTGTLLAALVTIKSAMAGGATITLDGTGFKAVFPTGTTITIDASGFTIMKGTKTVFKVDQNGNADYKGNVSVGASIHVDNDVFIGQKLYFDGANFSAGIVFKPGIEIYHDPSSNALFLSTIGNIRLNGMDVVSEINSLKARVSALESAGPPGG